MVISLLSLKRKIYRSIYGTSLWLSNYVQGIKVDADVFWRECIDSITYTSTRTRGSRWRKNRAWSCTRPNHERRFAFTNSKKCEVAISYVGGRKAFRTPAGVEKNCYHLGCTSISKGNYTVKCQKVDLMPIMILWLNYKDVIFLFMLLPLLKYEIKLLKMIKYNVRKRLLVGNNLFPDVTPKFRVLSWRF